MVGVPTIPLEDAAQHFGEMPDRIARAAKRGLVWAAMRGVQTIVTQIIPSRSPSPVDRGVYRAGWRVDVRNERVFIQNLETHASFIEDGVAPQNVKTGRAMITALAEWAIRKGLARDEKQARSMAFAIATNMKRRGIFNRDGKKGLGVLREYMKVHAKRQVEEAIKASVEQEMRNG